MKLLLDTVTVSEFRKGDGKSAAVHRWQASLADGMFGLSVVTVAEIRYGIRRVERKDPPFAERLRDWYSLLVAQNEMFHILPIDRLIAEHAADIRSVSQCPYQDAFIAATAKVHNLTLATRNTGDFEAYGIDLVNPWEFNACPPSTPGAKQDPKTRQTLPNHRERRSRSEQFLGHGERQGAFFTGNI